MIRHKMKVPKTQMSWNLKKGEDPKRTFPLVRVLVVMIYAQERSKEKDGKRESDRCP